VTSSRYLKAQPPLVHSCLPSTVPSWAFLCSQSWHMQVDACRRLLRIFFEGAAGAVVGGGKGCEDED
jgi:hypothetical protein